MLLVHELLSPEAFYVHAHLMIYLACCALHSSHHPVDLQTVTNWLSDHDLLSTVGSKMKMAQLLNRTVTSINVDALARLVAEKLEKQIVLRAKRLLQVRSLRCLRSIL